MLGPNLITKLPDDIHDWMPASPQTPHVDNRPSPVRRRDGVIDTLKAIKEAIKEERKFRCPYEDSYCRRYRSEAHTLVWHFDPYAPAAPQLEPSPLLTRIGKLPELINNILSHLDDGDLYDCMQVNKAWAKDAVRFIWHAPDFTHLLSASISNERIHQYAALVRHIDYTSYTGVKPNFGLLLLNLGFPDGPIPRRLPHLPGLISVQCEPSSLSDRTVEELSAIFMSTLKRLGIHDHAAYRWSGSSRFHSQLEGISWFDIMAKNCLRLTSITLGSDLHITTSTFEQFLKSAAHLRSVTLGERNEHLLVDALCPILKRANVNIGHQLSVTSAFTSDQLSGMHALERLELTLSNVWLTGRDILNFKAMTRLQSLHIYMEDDFARTGCSATAGELAEMIQAMPLLAEFTLLVPCTFMEGHPELLRDESEIGTYFDGHICRPQYLIHLHELAEEERASAVAALNDSSLCS